MPLTSKQMIKLLKQNGFKIVGQNGSHVNRFILENNRRICMAKLFYPAIFHAAEEGGFWVTFPDLPECMTEGDNMEQAYEMAVEALGLALSCREKESQPIPAASLPNQIVIDGGILVVVEFDMLEYKKKHNAKAVKKTLSIPEWLNEAAIKQNINFSQVLQEALLMKMNL